MSPAHSFSPRPGPVGPIESRYKVHLPGKYAPDMYMYQLPVPEHAVCRITPGRRWQVYKVQNDDGGENNNNNGW
jgi:hypothetical protein